MGLGPAGPFWLGGVAPVAGKEKLKEDGAWPAVLDTLSYPLSTSTSSQVISGPESCAGGLFGRATASQEESREELRQVPGGFPQAPGAGPGRQGRGLWAK